MKLILSFILVLFFIGCSTVQKITNENIEIKKNQNFITSLNKNFKIKYNDDGDFLELKIKYLVKIKIDIPSTKNKAIEESFKKAKSDVSHFTNEIITSSIFKEQIISTLRLSSFYSESKNDEILKKLIIDIKKRKKNIIKNLYIDSSAYNRKSKQISLTIISSSMLSKTIKKINNFLIK